VLVCRLHDNSGSPAGDWRSFTFSRWLADRALAGVKKQAGSLSGHGGAGWVVQGIAQIGGVKVLTPGMFITTARESNRRLLSAFSAPVRVQFSDPALKPGTSRRLV